MDAKIALPFQINKIASKSRPFILSSVEGTQILSRTIVAASGARYRKLDFAHPFNTAGVYYAATGMEKSLPDLLNNVVSAVGEGAMAINQIHQHFSLLASELVNR